jgi:hypothetical protein
MNFLSELAIFTNEEKVIDLSPVCSMCFVIYDNWMHL